MSSEDEDYLSRLQAAALRARASGFDGTADAIEEILRKERQRRESARKGLPGETKAGRDRGG